MNSKVHHVAPGFHAVAPYLIVNDSNGAIEFYKQAFGASELFRMPRPDGKVGHAEIQMGDKEDLTAEEIDKRAAALFGSK